MTDVEKINGLVQKELAEMCEKHKSVAIEQFKN